MEYLKYDYKNVKKGISFTNYDSFITNNRCFKFYLFDTFLAQYDLQLTDEIRAKARKYAYTQKILTIVPYIVTPIIFFGMHQSGVFLVKDFNSEVKYIFNLFLAFTAFRLAQKGVIKYQGDNLFVK